MSDSTKTVPARFGVSPDELKGAVAYVEDRPMASWLISSYKGCVGRDDVG